MNLSLIIPSHNNLRHLKNAYFSVRKHAPEIELIIVDDASTDGTLEWISDMYREDHNLVILRSEERKGHTYHYDYGISQAKGDVVGIMHADMIMGPNYIKNMVKHLKPGVVVAGTRVEPPLHPPGNEKIIQNFGMDFDDLNIRAFEDFCLKQQEIDRDQTSEGMFAPWIIYKEDFLAMGGHDQIYAPFPYEDSDIFERWILNGYKLVQSRDALVYHLTCRGHRWTDQVGKDDDYFKRVSQRASREYLRKWGSWIKNDEYQHPIIKPKYDIGFVVKNCDFRALYFLEPMCDAIYVESKDLVSKYIDSEQPNTYFNLSSRVNHIDSDKDQNILVFFDTKDLNEQNFQMLQQFPEILKESGAIGDLELGVFKFKVFSLKTYEKRMIQPVKRFLLD
jgi:glycosyltransferase involved in cell wall biosynthesis